MGGICGIRSKRLLVATGVVGLASALLSEPALAQLPLGSAQSGTEPSLGPTLGAVTNSLPTTQVAQQTTPVVQQVAEPVAQVTAPLAESVAPVTAMATPVVQGVTAPVVQATEPALQLVAPVIQQTTAPVLAGVAPVVQVAAPVLEATQPVLEVATAPVGPASTPLADATTSLLHTMAPAVSSSVPQVAANTVLDTATDAATAQPTSTGATSFVAATDEPARRDSALASGNARPGRDHAVRARASVPRAAATNPSLTPRAAAPADVHKASAAKPAPLRPGGPSAPRGLLGFLAAISAAFASSAALIFVAALAAALVLAAPGLGRRLRPGLAPWPLHIALPSLERPG